LFVIPDGPPGGPIRNLEVDIAARDSGFASSTRPGMTLKVVSVIASQRVGAKRRPMTGSAKQSMAAGALKDGLLRRLRSSQ
jgi:hypothetical protein